MKYILDFLMCNTTQGARHGSLLLAIKTQALVTILIIVRTINTSILRTTRYQVIMAYITRFGIVDIAKCTWIRTFSKLARTVNTMFEMHAHKHWNIVVIADALVEFIRRNINSVALLFTPAHGRLEPRSPVLSSRNKMYRNRFTGNGSGIGKMLEKSGEPDNCSVFGCGHLGYLLLGCCRRR